jgi:uncharacterized delta-60 repeat protein
VTTTFGAAPFQASVRAVIPTANHGLIAVGGAAPSSSSSAESRFAIAKYRADGSLDPSFGGDGRVLTGFTGDAVATAVAMQDDGKIVVAGSMQVDFEGNNDVVLARYDHGGNLDPTFGGDGRVRTDFAEFDDRATDVAVLSDGKILVAGSAQPTEGDDAHALVRYLPDGTPDDAFGEQGWVITNEDPGSSFGLQGLNAMAVRPNGVIVGTGFAYDNDGDHVFGLAAYRPDGALQHHFGDGGLIFFDATDDDQDLSFDLSLAPGGRIMVAGGPLGRCVVARFDLNGDVDTSFGSNGVVETTFHRAEAECGVIAARPDGRIMIAGGTLSARTPVLVGRLLP